MSFFNWTKAFEEDDACALASQLQSTHSYMVMDYAKIQLVHKFLREPVSGEAMQQDGSDEETVVELVRHSLPTVALAFFLKECHDALPVQNPAPELVRRGN